MYRFDEAAAQDLVDDYLARFGEQFLDEADKPQFDILYQLRRVLDPTGSQGQQEASITDGRGRPVYGSRGREGDVVDLRYHAPGGPQMNWEVDLDPSSQREHRRQHLAAMNQAYQRWVAGGRRGPNPLEGVGSVFVAATRPGRRGQVGAITGVDRVQYRAGRDGRVRAVRTGRLPMPAGGMSPQNVARQFGGLFTALATLARPRRRMVR
jgi:hypothetical protein